MRYVLEDAVDLSHGLRIARIVSSLSRVVVLCMHNKQVIQGAGVSKQVDELATISVEELFQRLGTTKAGLSEEEAERRLDQYGPNEIAEEKARTWVHGCLPRAAIRW